MTKKTLISNNKSMLNINKEKIPAFIVGTTLGVIVAGIFFNSSIIGLGESVQINAIAQADSCNEEGVVRRGDTRTEKVDKFITKYHNRFYRCSVKKVYYKTVNKITKKVIDDLRREPVKVLQWVFDHEELNKTVDKTPTCNYNGKKYQLGPVDQVIEEIGNMTIQTTTITCVEPGQLKYKHVKSNADAQ